jgi:hypothetical protein
LTRVPIVAVALALAAALAATGCGSSKKSFADKANAICAKYHAKANALAQPRSAADIPGYVDQAKALFRSELAELHTTKPSLDKVALYNRWLDLAQTVFPVLDQLKTLGARNDLRGVQRLETKYQSVNQQAKSMARQLGLDQCAR